ncbi:MAG: YdcF family protein [Elusimicrobiales bacterium]|nr:YdcF family protein [Elusimicrobiales bacterium]
MKIKAIGHENNDAKDDSKKISDESKAENLDENTSWIKKAHYFLPGGDWRKLSKDLDNISVSIKKLKENYNAKWWTKLKNFFSPKKKIDNAKTIEQLERDISELHNKARKMGHWGFLIGMIGGCLLSTVAFSSLSSKFLIYFLEKDIQTEEEIADADVIIVIADDKHSSRGHFANENLDQDSLQRLISALQFSKKKNLPIMLAGAVEETDAMQKTALELGINPDKIYIEKNASNLKEKAINSRNGCSANGLKKPIVFTTAYKMRRTLCEFRRQGLNAKPFAVSQNKLELNKEAMADAIDYNPVMVKSAFLEYLKYIGSGCVFEKK